MNKYETVGDYIIETAEQVKVAMSKLIKEENIKGLEKVMQYAIEGGGKRLRPALTRLVANSLGTDDKYVMDISATCELLHSASLLLDDIQDLDRYRRGKLAPHEMFNIATSSFSSGQLMILAFKVGRRRSIDVMDLLMDTVQKLMEGQGLDTNMRSYNEAKYLKMIELKTASLYKAAAEVGAIVARAHSLEREYMAQYGTYFGIAYQIVDDWVDIKKSITYEEPVGDLITYKITLPIILMYQRYPETHEVLTRYIDKKPNSEKELITLFNSDEKYLQCLEDALKVAQDYVNMAIDESKKITVKNPDIARFFTEYPEYALGKLMKEV